MAAEAVARSGGFDHQLYVRKLVQQFMYGPNKLASTWIESLVVRGVMVTDAKSLRGHLRNTGSLPSERQQTLEALALFVAGRG